MRIRLVVGFLIALVAAAPSRGETPLSTAFTYQGQLKENGAPIDGTAHLRFSLWDAAGNGSPPVGGSQIGASQLLANVPMANGLFTVPLNAGGQFGANAFNGEARWLQVEVCADAGCGTLTILAPRQPLTAAPNAIRALSAETATNAAQLNGQAAAFYQNASNINSGTLADARLSPNVAFLDREQSFTDTQHFNQAPEFLAAGAPFYVDSTGLVQRLNADLLDGITSADFVQIANAQTITGAKTFSAAPSFTAPGVPFSVIGTSTVASLSADLLDGLNSTAFLQTIPVPLVVSGTNGGGVIKGSNTGTAAAVMGIQGEITSISATGNSYGGFFTNVDDLGIGAYGRAAGVSGVGVRGDATNATGTNFGVSGEADSTSGCGVFGNASASTGPAYGVYGQTASSAGYGVFGRAAVNGGYGVYGFNASATGNAVAIRGETNSDSGRAIWGVANSTTGTAYGVEGQTSSDTGYGVAGFAQNNDGGTGVFGRASSSLGGYGVHGWNTGATGTGVLGEGEYLGVYGKATADIGTTYGVYGQSFSANASAYGVWAQGRLGASGTKSFRIDHPDDPANKYLLHYAAESPEVINFYRGTVVLDGAGAAVVELPHYFAKINKTPSYQLTAVGAPMPMLHVAEEIDESALSAGATAGPGQPAPACTFRIAGGAPGAKVSWEVKAVRNDLWVRNRAEPVEIEKEGFEKGTYQHPEFYGQPPEMGMNYVAPADQGLHDRPDAERPPSPHTLDKALTP